MRERTGCGIGSLYMEDKIPIICIFARMCKNENPARMDYEHLLIEQHDKVRVITIHRPNELNALNGALLSELDCAFAEASADDSTLAVILTGEGKSFVAGADIAEMAAMGPAEGKSFGVLGSEVFRRIELMDKAVIAAVNGYALGGGCELALACDIRIGSEKAKIGQPETGLGITPGFSGTQRLARIVGEGRAKELIFTAQVIDAREAFRIGLFNKVVPAEELMSEAMKMARTIASKAPLAVRYSKEAINRGLQTDIDSGIAIENNLFGLCFASRDQKEGMEAFLEKRSPVFAGR